MGLETEAVRREHSTIETCPAKINLTLEVHGRRADGFHDLRSLVIGVDLRDRLHARLRQEPGIELVCSDPTLSGPGNLVYRAAARLAECLGLEPAIRLELEKHIPIAAGLGGGSSDAATTLRVCNELWAGGLPADELAAIGAELGSDVPLFFSLPAALMTGRGERVSPVRLSWRGWVLLVFVDTAVLTARVFASWRASDAADLPRGQDQAIIGATSADDVLALTTNHLEPAVFRVAPAVARAAEEINRAHLGPVRVSGAGSTFFRLFDDRQAALHVATRMEALPIELKTAVVRAPVGADAGASGES